MADVPLLKYSRPGTLAAAHQALAGPGARAYAGGTDLLPALADRRPWVRGVRELVDLKDLPGARGIRERGRTLWIGALTTAAELVASDPVRRHAPALAEAARLTAAPMIRARGTVGGNLMTPHPTGDVATALVALDAIAEVVDRGGRRRIAVADLVARRRAPPGGAVLILGVSVPKAPRSGFEKLGTRPGFGRAVAAVAVAHRANGSRVAVAGVAGWPIVAPHTGRALFSGGDLAAALARDLRRAPAAIAAATDHQLIEILLGRAHRRAMDR